MVRTETYLRSQSGNGPLVDRSSPIKNLCSTGLLKDWTGPNQKSGLSSTSSTKFASWADVYFNCTRYSFTTILRARLINAYMQCVHVSYMRICPMWSYNSSWVYQAWPCYAWHITVMFDTSAASEEMLFCIGQSQLSYIFHTKYFHLALFCTCGA